jgi:hypothetical protein
MRLPTMSTPLAIDGATQPDNDSVLVLATELDLAGAAGKFPWRMML